MLKKIKFKPRVTQIKLNPEQAVLVCGCWIVGLVSAGCMGGSAPACPSFKGIQSGGTTSPNIPAT